MAKTKSSLLLGSAALALGVAVPAMAQSVQIGGQDVDVNGGLPNTGGTLNTAGFDIDTSGGNIDLSAGPASGDITGVDEINANSLTLNGSGGTALTISGGNDLVMNGGDIILNGGSTIQGLSVSTSGLTGTITNDVDAANVTAGQLTVSGTITNDGVGIGSDVAVNDDLLVQGSATIGGDLNMTGGRISGLQDGILSTDAATVGQVDQVGQDVNSAQADINGLQADMSAAQTDINALQADLIQTGQNLTSAQSDINGLQSDMTTAQGDINALQQDVNSAQADINGLQADMSAAQTDINALQADLIQTGQNLTSAQSDINGLQSDMTTAQGDINALQANFDGQNRLASGVALGALDGSYNAAAVSAVQSAITAPLTTQQNILAGLSSEAGNLNSAVSALQSALSSDSYLAGYDSDQQQLASLNGLYTAYADTLGDVTNAQTDVASALALFTANPTQVNQGIYDDKIAALAAAEAARDAALADYNTGVASATFANATLASALQAHNIDPTDSNFFNVSTASLPAFSTANLDAATLNALADAQVAATDVDGTFANIGGTTRNDLTAYSGSFAAVQNAADDAVDSQQLVVDATEAQVQPQLAAFQATQQTLTDAAASSNTNIAAASETLTTDANGDAVNFETEVLGALVNHEDRIATLETTATTLAADIAAGDAGTLAAAQTYADAGDAGTLAAAQTYADAGDAATLALAQSYTDDAVSAEATARQDADTALQTAINNEVTARIADVDAEEARARAAEGVLTTNLAAEATARASADTALNTRVDNEVTARIADVDAEEARARAAEGVLTTNLAAEATARASADTALQTAISNEVAARVADVDAEESRARAAEVAEATTRASADTALQTAITNETNARSAADIALNNRVDGVSRRVDALDNKVRESTALAVALGGAVFLPDTNFNLTANVGHYDGKTAGSMQFIGRVNKNVAINAGAAVGFNGSTVAIRGGVTFGW